MAQRFQGKNGRLCAMLFVAAAGAGVGVLPLAAAPVGVRSCLLQGTIGNQVDWETGMIGRRNRQDPDVAGAADGV
jgi:hypothetical protein